MVWFITILCNQIQSLSQMKKTSYDFRFNLIHLRFYSLAVICNWIDCQLSLSNWHWGPKSWFSLSRSVGNHASLFLLERNAATQPSLGPTKRQKIWCFMDEKNFMHLRTGKYADIRSYFYFVWQCFSNFSGNIFFLKKVKTVPLAPFSGTMRPKIPRLEPSPRVKFLYPLA